jgi:hypothetical protein
MVLGLMAGLKERAAMIRTSSTRNLSFRVLRHYIPSGYTFPRLDDRTWAIGFRMRLL